MRLVAVTICINYSDYLECVIENRVHFDRWVVMTVAGDVATHALCAKYGIECYDSELLQADGRDFHAVDNKGPVLNEGLGLVDGSWLMADGRDASAGVAVNQPSTIIHQPTWCVVLDADVLLPRDFGERVRALPLETGVLYGAAGRKFCETREQFEMLRECEPWDRLSARHSQALGYLNLFSLEALPNRYPVRTTEGIWEHDDYLFTESFAPEKRRPLPFTVLHVGKIGANWGGRVTERYVARAAKVDGSGLMGDGCDASAVVEIHQLSTFNHQPCRAAAVIGYFPGGRWQEVTRGFGSVVLVDHFGVHSVSGDGMVEADRVALRGIFAREMEGRGGIQMLGAHGVENVGRVADGSLDLLYIPGEVSPESLCTMLPYWLPKLRDGATICGDAYGLPHWPDATYSVALLFGTPEVVGADGHWRKEYRVGARPLPPFCEKDGSERDGLVVVSEGSGAVEALLLTIHSARKHWNGPIQLWRAWHGWQRGSEDESLRIVCARLGVEFLPMCGAVPTGRNLVEDACVGAPFARTLVLKPGHLLLGAPQFSGAAGLVAMEEGGPLLVRRDGDSFTVQPGASVGVAAFAGGESESILVCEGEMAEWSEASWERWCEAEMEATEYNVAEVRVAAGTTVVTVVLPEELGDFQRNWLTWKFRETETLVVLVDVAVESFWLPETGRARVLSVSGEQAADRRGLFARIEKECATERVLFVSPQISALPGAELWTGLANEDWSAVHFSPLARKEPEVTGNVFFPKISLALVAKSDLRAIAEEGDSFARGFCEWAMKKERDGGRIVFSDVAEMGWKLPGAYDWEGGMVSNGAHELGEREDGLLQLAEDVVVISLPERVDRQDRVREMMAEEKVWFRFVDGVRVLDADILPAEIAEVGKQNFKMVAGFDKYLRGMVGCRRAHLRELEAAKAAGRKSLFIIEDDMCFTWGWREKLEAALRELPEGWLQLHLSAMDFRPSGYVSHHLRRLGGAYQTTAILYSEAGIAAALNCLRHSRSEIDHWMGHHLHPFGNSYVVHPRIANQQGGVSDIMSFDRGVTQ